MSRHAVIARACMTCYESPSGVINGDIEYLIIEYKSHIDVIICGSEPILGDGRKKGWIDWLRNMRVCPWPDRYCGWSHAGWLKAARKMAKFINDYAKSKDKTIGIHGHSMGGAVSVLAAQTCMEKYGLNVVRCVLFASPKPFAFSRPDYKFNVFAYENEGDIVPDTPPFFTSVASSVIRLSGNPGHDISHFYLNLASTNT